MGKHTWLISSGHGSNTPGKRYKFSNGLEIFEYDVNRKIAEKLFSKLEYAGVDFVRINPETTDITNTLRIRRANEFQKKYGNCVYVSIHNNAASDESANGFEWFTTRGVTNSDKIVKVFHRNQKALFPELRDRGIKEADFTELMGSMPSVLGEFMFFTNRKEAEILLSDEGQNRCAMVLFNSIIEIETNSN